MSHFLLLAALPFFHHTLEPFSQRPIPLQRNPKISGPLLFFCSISFFAVFIFLMSQCSIFKLCLSDRIVLQLYLPPEMFYNLITPVSLSLEKERKKNNLKSASQVHVSPDKQFVTVTVDRFAWAA